MADKKIENVGGTELEQIIGLALVEMLPIITQKGKKTITSLPDKSAVAIHKELVAALLAYFLRIVEEARPAYRYNPNLPNTGVNRGDEGYDLGVADYAAALKSRLNGGKA